MKFFEATREPCSYTAKCAPEFILKPFSDFVYPRATGGGFPSR